MCIEYCKYVCAKHARNNNANDLFDFKTIIVIIIASEGRVIQLKKETQTLLLNWSTFDNVIFAILPKHCFTYSDQPDRKVQFQQQLKRSAVIFQFWDTKACSNLPGYTKRICNVRWKTPGSYSFFVKPYVVQPSLFHESIM